MYSLVCNQDGGINVNIKGNHIWNPLARLGTTLAHGTRSMVERWCAEFLAVGVSCYVMEHR